MDGVDPKSPIYLRLREAVRGKIEGGEYPPGTAIPSENTLAGAYGINRLTVRGAVDALVDEGLLRRVQGKGVYVLGQKAEQNASDGFTSVVLDGRAPLRSQVIAKVRRPAGGKYAGIFGIKPDNQLYYIKRVEYADNGPYSMQESFIPEYIMPKLGDIDLSVFSLREVYGFYNLLLTRTAESLQLIRLQPGDARILCIQSGLDMMLLTCTSWDSEGRAVEHSRSYARADKCGYNITFKDSPEF